MISRKNTYAIYEHIANHRRKKTKEKLGMTKRRKDHIIILNRHGG